MFYGTNLTLIKTHRRLVCIKDPNLSTSPLFVHINQDIKKEIYKNKDSTVYITEYWSKRNQTVKPGWARQQTQHQAPTLSYIDKSLSQNRHKS